ncbi:MAG: hypothetical protein Q9169_006891 [Polycauliona sp. 2 TL-2023]
MQIPFEQDDTIHFRKNDADFPHMAAQDWHTTLPARGPMDSLSEKDGGVLFTQADGSVVALNQGGHPF